MYVIYSLLIFKLLEGYLRTGAPMLTTRHNRCRECLLLAIQPLLLCAASVWPPRLM